MSLLPTRCALLFFMIVAGAPSTFAQISVAESTTIEFAGTRLSEGARWSSSFELTDGGLVTKPAGPNSSWDVWFESPPLSAGMSWRPPTSTRLKLILTGLETEGSHLRAFSRYSSDQCIGPPGTACRKSLPTRSSQESSIRERSRCHGLHGRSTMP